MRFVPRQHAFGQACHMLVAGGGAHQRGPCGQILTGAEHDDIIFGSDLIHDDLKTTPERSYKDESSAGNVYKIPKSVNNRRHAAVPLGILDLRQPCTRLKFGI
jgi:hypothetical protein